MNDQKDWKYTVEKLVEGGPKNSKWQVQEIKSGQFWNQKWTISAQMNG